jgi:ACR3 family arsenite transporter
MSTATLPLRPVPPAPMSVFERYLTVWVFLCIVVGIALGQILQHRMRDIGSR